MGNYGIDHSLTAYVIGCLIDSIHVSNTSKCGVAAYENADVYVVNSTFANNSTDAPISGATFVLLGNSNVFVHNSIFYDVINRPFYLSNWDWESNHLEVYHSLVQGGEDEIYEANPNNVIVYDDSNIDADPLWANDGWFPYMLMPGSPCINTGTLDLPSHIHLPETDLAGNPRVYDGQIDMGAYEFGPWVGLDYQKPKVKSQKLTASPNPFRDHCQVKYECKEQGQQSIFVYELMGNKVATLMDITGQPASGQLNWNGTDDYGRKLKPGIYILELTNNKRSLGSVKVEIF